MLISIIAAIGRNRELGKNNDLLWNIPADLLNFKRLTLGHHVIMGRKTFESIGSALPARICIVVSSGRSSLSQNHLSAHNGKNVVFVKSLEEGVLFAQRRGESELFVIGGASIYDQALRENLVDKLYLSLINDERTDADRFFPEVDLKGYRLLESKDFHAYKNHPAWNYKIFEK
jgi:dihydrofolate reductase